MKTDIQEIQSTLIDFLKSHQPSLKINAETDVKFEVSGTIPTMQGKQKVDGIYFGSVIPKAKDCRLYFFPIYTDTADFADISPELRKCLKGKSCFHIKKMDEQLEQDIKAMIDKGIEVYRAKGILK
jgi:hypothetical protein